jgi:hypothetical protein
MPHHQKHRGQQSDDIKIFSEPWIPTLRLAVKDLSYLLSADYADASALKLVGDRYRLNERQRKAVMRSACSNQSLQIRLRKEICKEFLENEIIELDAYNVLIIIESALSNGIILYCRDGCYRDLAGVHGNYRKVEETIPALELIGDVLSALNVAQVNWYLDSPVSNSGRLKMMMLDIAQRNEWNWQSELVHSPDKVLIESSHIIASADGVILDKTKMWFNLTGIIIEQYLSAVNIKKIH